MESSKSWEEILSGMGMPAEIPNEEAKAREAGVELIPESMTTEEARLLAEKLKEEDPRNVLGGFPDSMKGILSLITTFVEEGRDIGVDPKDTRIAVHSSCVNKNDCIMVTRSSGGEIYHYNTMNMTGYSRSALASRLENLGFSLKEK